jgi:5-methylcytosine-specific restriction endonuclease McrA
MPYRRIKKKRKGLREKGMLLAWWKKTTQNHMKRVTHGLPRLTLYEWRCILEKWQQSCAYCGEYKADFKDLWIEHLQPVSRGGFHRKENIVPACQACNQRKGEMTLEEFRLKELEHGRKLRIFESPQELCE